MSFEWTDCGSQEKSSAATLLLRVRKIIFVEDEFYYCKDFIYLYILIYI